MLEGSQLACLVRTHNQQGLIDLSQSFLVDPVGLWRFTDMQRYLWTIITRRNAYYMAHWVYKWRCNRVEFWVEELNRPSQKHSLESDLEEMTNLLKEPSLLSSVYSKLESNVDPLMLLPRYSTPISSEFPIWDTQWSPTNTAHPHSCRKMLGWIGRQALRDLNSTDPPSSDIFTQLGYPPVTILKQRTLPQCQEIAQIIPIGHCIVYRYDAVRRNKFERWY